MKSMPMEVVPEEVLLVVQSLQSLSPMTLWRSLYRSKCQVESTVTLVSLSLVLNMAIFYPIGFNMVGYPTP